MPQWDIPTPASQVLNPLQVMFHLWLWESSGADPHQTISVLWAFLLRRKGDVPPPTGNEESCKCFKRGDHNWVRSRVTATLLSPADCWEERTTTVNFCPETSLYVSTLLQCMWAPSVEQGHLPLGCASSSLLQALDPRGVQLQMPKGLGRVKQEGVSLSLYAGLQHLPMAPRVTKVFCLGLMYLS